MRWVGVCIVVVSTWLGACSGSEETHPQATAYPHTGFSLATHGLVGATDAEGRQCLESGNQLSDGIWFGVVEGIDAGFVVVDIACYWSGEGAAAQAASDGHQPVLFYLINEDPRTYTVVLDASGTAHWVDGESAPEPIPMADWPVAGSTFDQRCPDETCGAWLFINDGAVTELVEWYLPRWETWNSTLPIDPWGPANDVMSTTTDDAASASTLGVETDVPSEASATTAAVPTTSLTLEFEEEGPYVVTRPIGCDAAPGSPTDLDAEPASWLVFGSFMRWEDASGCLVRIDVISHIRGAEHCDLQQAEFITIGPSLGEPFSSSVNSLRFVWNGGGVISGIRTGEVLLRSSLEDSA